MREKLDGFIDLQTNRWNIEIEILISKRPRDEITASSGQGKPKTPVLSDSRDTRAKLSLDFQLKLDPDIFKRNDSVCSHAFALNYVILRGIRDS